MKKVKIQITEKQLSVIEQAVIIAGTVGLTVEYVFDQGWDSRNKTAVFQVNGKMMDAPIIGNRAVIPWELLEKPGVQVMAGVFGIDGIDNTQHPTTWVELGVIQPGAVPAGQTSNTPTLPGWQQLAADVEKALDQIIAYQKDMINGVVVPVLEVT